MTRFAVFMRKEDKTESTRTDRSLYVHGQNAKLKTYAQLHQYILSEETRYQARKHKLGIETSKAQFYLTRRPNFPLAALIGLINKSIKKYHFLSQLLKLRYSLRCRK